MAGILTMPDEDQRALGRLEAQTALLLTSMEQLSSDFRGFAGDLRNLSSELKALAHLPAEFAALELRVRALEQSQQRSIGERGVGAMILRSPMLGWLVGAAGAVWALFHQGGK